MAWLCVISSSIQQNETALTLCHDYVLPSIRQKETALTGALNMMNTQDDQMTQKVVFIPRVAVGQCCISSTRILRRKITRCKTLMPAYEIERTCHLGLPTVTATVAMLTECTKAAGQEAKWPTPAGECKVGRVIKVFEVSAQLATWLFWDSIAP